MRLVDAGWDASAPQERGAKMLVPRILVPQDGRSGTPTIRPVDEGWDESAPAEQIARLHPSVIALRENLFNEALLERTSARQPRRAVDWTISLGIHLAFLGALLALPLFFTAAIDFRQFMVTTLVAPPTPLPPLSPVAVVPHASPKPAKPFSETAKLIAPTVVPRVTRPGNQDGSLPDLNIQNIVGDLSSGVPGGVPGGMVGGVLFGAELPTAPTAPTAPVANAPKAPYRVGFTVKEPRLIYSVQPDYPLLARQAQVQGTVSIDAVIDEHGDVVEAHAISGIPLLIAPALQSVAKWKYEPTYLNGVPVAVELTVTVIFRFR